MTDNCRKCRAYKMQLNISTMPRPQEKVSRKLLQSVHLQGLYNFNINVTYFNDSFREIMETVIHNLPFYLLLHDYSLKFRNKPDVYSIVIFLEGYVYITGIRTRSPCSVILPVSFLGDFAR